MIISRKVMMATYFAEVDMPRQGQVRIIRMWRDDSDHQRGAMSFWMVQSYRPDLGGTVVVALLLGQPGKGYPEELSWSSATVVEVLNPMHYEKYGTAPPPGHINPEAYVGAKRAPKAESDVERKARRAEASRRCRERKAQRESEQRV